MGIYIPDMKMPSSCLMCDIPVRVQPCPVDHDNVSNYKTSRHPACPLLPVPEHGRLGDLDKLADNMRSATAGMEHRAIIMHEIRRAPTVIPAEPFNNLSKPCKEDEAE